MQPNWKIRTKLQTHEASGYQRDASTRALTSNILEQVCSDPALGFVISPQDLGFEALHHTEAGSWKGWNLYDCRRARGS
jgi:hypothetical protein